MEIKYNIMYCNVMQYNNQQNKGSLFLEIINSQNKIITMRTSLFSKNINKQLLKSLQNQYSNRKSNKSILQDFNGTKKSIFNQSNNTIQINQDTIKDYTQQNQMYKTAESYCKKQYDAEDLYRLKQSLISLPRLNQKNRHKKQKQKHLNIQFIKFFFRILKKSDVIQKLLQSYIPHEILLTEFTTMAEGLRLKQVEGGSILDINIQDNQFYLLLQGFVERKSIRQSARMSRRSMTQMNSQSSPSLRVKGRNKTTKQKDKIKCLDKNQPVFINEEDSNNCTIKILSDCTFILLDKRLWQRLLTNLQKIQDKSMIHFIQESTTINLAAYKTIFKDQQQQQGSERKKFLYDLKNLKIGQLYLQQQQNKSQQEIGNININGKLPPLYELVTLIKGDKRTINNRDIYIVSKGNLFIQTESYDINISEGSIVNSSILLEIQQKYIKIKTTKTCLLVKIFLNNIIFMKQEQDLLINKIKQIQTNRQKIYGKKKDQQANLIENKQNIYKNQYNLKSIKINQTQRLNKKFQPNQIQLKSWLYAKKSKSNSNTKQKQRISIHHEKIKTQKSAQKSYFDDQVYRRKQLSRKISIRYANNYCIFQKLIQSKQRVFDVVLKNEAKKNIPFQISLKKDTIRPKLNPIIEQEEIQKIIKFDQDILCDQNINQLAKLNRENKDRQFKTNIQRSKFQSSTVINLQKQMRNAQKNRFQKIKKQKNKDLQNLFQVDKLDQKSILLKRQFDQINKVKKNKTFDFMKPKIDKILQQNSNIRLQQIVNQKSYVSFPGDSALVETERILKKGICKMNKYTNTLVMTENLNTFQSFISGQNFKLNLSILDNKEQTKRKRFNFLGQKPKNLNIHTKKIIASMLTGRLRQSHNK